MNKTKLVSLLLSSVLTLGHSFSAFAGKGGVGDGGGGFANLAADPITEPLEFNQQLGNMIDGNAKSADFYKLAHLVVISKSVLPRLISRIEKAQIIFPMSEAERFIRSHADELKRVTTQAKYAVTIHKDCLDGAGDARDASIHTGRSDAHVCMSMKRLTYSVESSQYEKHIFALMMHEASHLVGADEEMAEVIQKLSLEVLLPIEKVEDL